MNTFATIAKIMDEKITALMVEIEELRAARVALADFLNGNAAEAPKPKPEKPKPAKGQDHSGQPGWIDKKALRETIEERLAEQSMTSGALIQKFGFADKRSKQAVYAILSEMKATGKVWRSEDMLYSLSGAHTTQ